MIIKAEITCKKCNRIIRGRITINKKNQITDSDGFMIFEDGAICDTCLQEIHHN